MLLITNNGHQMKWEMTICTFELWIINESCKAKVVNVKVDHYLLFICLAFKNKLSCLITKIFVYINKWLVLILRKTKSVPPIIVLYIPWQNQNCKIIRFCNKRLHDCIGSFLLFCFGYKCFKRKKEKNRFTWKLFLRKWNTKNYNKVKSLWNN